MNIMQGVLILSTLLAVSVRSQNTVDSLFLQVSDMEDAGMIFAGSVAIKVYTLCCKCLGSFAFL